MNKIKVFHNYLSSGNFALLQNSYMWKLTFYHLKTFFYYMMNKNNFFYNYTRSENFALLQNFCIWKLAFDHLKMFFNILFIKQKFSNTIYVVKILHLYTIPANENLNFTI